MNQNNKNNGEISDPANQSEEFEDVEELDELEDDTGGDAEQISGYEVRQPEPAAAATVGSGRNSNGRNVLAAAVYGGALLVVVVGFVIFLLYFRSGANTQNANLKVERGRSSSNSSTEVSNPTYEEAANLVKPLVTASPTNGGELPPPASPTTGSGVLEPTTGYTLSGGNDYISPTPKPVPVPITKTSSENSTGGNSTRDAAITRNSDKADQADPPVLPRVISNQIEQTPSRTENLSSPGGGRTSSDGRTSIYYYASTGGSAEPKAETVPLENNKYPRTLPFGTVLPVRLVGAIHSLSNRGLVQMELTRAVSDGKFFLPRGTLFIGRNAGSAADRIFVELTGYLDGRGNLISLGGDVLNTDGSVGIKGKRERLGSRLQRYLSPVASTARQFGLAYLQSRTNSSVVVLPSSSVLPVLGEAGSTARSSNNEFISVAAGGFAYIFINNLPPPVEYSDSDGDAKSGVFSPSNEIKALTDNSPSADGFENLSPELQRQITRSRNK